MKPVLEMVLQREPSAHGATLGRLTAGDFACHTLEDVIREQPGIAVAKWKVQNQTAIPAGRYRVIITPSSRFKRPLPLLLDVPGFSGIRIHPGNGPLDTDGCILVGLSRSDGRVLFSRKAFGELFELLRVAPGDIWIDIRNPKTEVRSQELRA